MSKLKSMSKSVNIDPNKVGIYVRYSTDEQGEGTTVEVQLTRDKDYVKSQGWNVNPKLIYIDEGYSGGSLDRPDITRCRNDVKKGLLDCLVFMKLDRLSRNVVDTVNLVLDEWDEICYVKSVTEPFDTTNQLGRQILTMLAGFAEWERYTIKERTFGGKVQRAEEGRNPGFKAPYGYKVGSTTGSFEIIPAEAEVIRRIFREYRMGKGRAAITSELNREGIPFRKGKLWNDSTIAHILCNPLYIGRLVYGRLQRNSKRNKRDGEPFWNRNDNPMVKELTEEIITPIITVDEFEVVRKIRESRNVFKDRQTSGRTFTSPHLLSGLLKCKCGHGFTSRKKQGKDNYSYYFCRGVKTKGDSFCDCGYLRQDVIDQEVVRQVKEEFLNRKSNIQSLVSKRQEARIQVLQAALIDIPVRIIQIDNELERIKKDYRSGKMDIDDYNEFKQEIKKEKDNLEQKQQTLQKELDDINLLGISSKDIIEMSEYVEQWDELTLEFQKNLLLKWVDYVLVYKPKGKGTEVDLHVELNTSVQIKKDEN